MCIIANPHEFDHNTAIFSRNPFNHQFNAEWISYYIAVSIQNIALHGTCAGRPCDSSFKENDAI